MNILLVIFKATVGLIANSISIILDALNNLSDVLSAFVTMFGTILSSKRPDKKHPYGHGRIEYFSAVIVSIIVIAAGIVAMKESIEKIINPVEATYTAPTLIIIIVAIIVKFFFGIYVKNKGKELKSKSLIATGIDAISDSVVSFSTLIGAIISLIWHISIEGYIGIIISIMILKAAIEILKDTIDDLIGIRADVEEIKALKNEVMKFKEVEGVYDIILHKYGPSKIIASLHIQVEDNMTAKEIHRLSRKIVYKVYEKLGIILTIGVYASNDTEEYKELRDYIQELINENKNIIQIHGFYVDEDVKTVYFDLIFDFAEQNPENIVKEMQKKLKKKFNGYDFNIIIDTDISD